jgi:hypothetical protein
MKKISLLFAVVICFFALVKCESQKDKNALTHERAIELLTNANAYPKIVEYRIFCGGTETAQKVRNSDLEEQGLVSVQLSHTPADIGKPLVTFTEKAKPYLLVTSDTARSLDIQKVKLADENINDVKEISVSADGKKALVDFTVSMENLTPFIVLLEREMEKIQSRQTYFTFSNNAWSWDGKIITSSGNK